MDYETPAGAWAAQFTKKTFGTDTEAVESNPSATTSAQNFLKNDPRRLGFIVFNLGTDTVFFGRSPKVTSTNGFPLQALGGGVSAQVNEDAEVSAYEWWFLANSGSQKLYVLEIRGI